MNNQVAPFREGTLVTESKLKEFLRNMGDGTNEEEEIA